MNINIWAPSTLALIVGFVIVLIGALRKKSGTRKTLFMFGLPLAGVGLIVLLVGASLPDSLNFLNTPLWGGLGQTVDVGGNVITYSTGIQQTSIPLSGACAYQPTATYTQKDKFSSLIPSGGTAYYKVNGQPTTSTAITNLNRGTEYTYWYSNLTTFVLPKSKVADCGANDFIADAWRNGSVTINTYDTVNHQTTTSSAYNTSVGANGQSNFDITYQGTSKQSAMPFGGFLIVEYNSTISDVTCTGSVLRAGNPSNFHLTFTTSATTHTYKAFEVGPEIDDGSGSSKIISCQVTNGATDLGIDPLYIRFISANYYLTNSGEIVLDTEKFANQDNTRTGMGTRSVTNYWS